MKISKLMLLKPQEISFDGSASWTSQICHDLNIANQNPSCLEGTVKIIPEPSGFIKVLGSVQACATLNCDRCDEAVSLPLKSEIDVMFRPPYSSEAPQDLSLSGEDFDVYFLENERLDLEQVIIDALQCAVPSRILCGPDSANGCHLDQLAEEKQIYADPGDSGSKSPFANLGQMVQDAQKLKKS